MHKLLIINRIILNLEYSQVLESNNKFKWLFVTQTALVNFVINKNCIMFHKNKI